MAITIDVVYDGNVLKPQTPLNLQPNAHYLVTIEEQSSPANQPNVAGEDEARAWEIYDSKLKELLEPEHNGEMVAIHLQSKDYEVSRRSIEALNALRQRRPEGIILLMDIGQVAENDPIELRRAGVLPSKRKAS